MNNSHKRAYIKEDLFLRLPDELLISSIFDRVHDLKSLFLCSLVSKHFASLISQVRTVSITVSGSETYSEDYYKIVAKLVMDVCNSTVEQIPTLLDSPSFQHMKLPKFLEKLRELEHIRLEYKCPKNSVQPPFPMWEVKFAGNSARIESFVALVQPGSIKVKDTGNELVQKQESNDEKPHECLYLFRGRYMEWMCIIRMLLKHRPSLQSVTITDSGKQGTLVIGHDQLINIKNEVFDELVKEFSRKRSKGAWAPYLHLPLSGYVIRRVYVLTIHARADVPRASDDDSTVIKEVIQLLLRKPDTTPYRLFLKSGR